MLIKLIVGSGLAHQHRIETRTGTSEPPSKTSQHNITRNSPKTQKTLTTVESSTRAPSYSHPSPSQPQAPKLLSSSHEESNDRELQLDPSRQNIGACQDRNPWFDPTSEYYTENKAHVSRSWPCQGETDIAVKREELLRSKHIRYHSGEGPDKWIPNYSKEITIPEKWQPCQYSSRKIKVDCRQKHIQPRYPSEKQPDLTSKHDLLEERLKPHATAIARQQYHTAADRDAPKTNLKLKLVHQPSPPLRLPLGQKGSKQDCRSELAAPTVCPIPLIQYLRSPDAGRRPRHDVVGRIYAFGHRQTKDVSQIHKQDVAFKRAFSSKKLPNAIVNATNQTEPTVDTKSRSLGESAVVADESDIEVSKPNHTCTVAKSTTRGRNRTERPYVERSSYEKRPSPDWEAKSNVVLDVRTIVIPKTSEPNHEERTPKPKTENKTDHQLPGPVLAIAEEHHPELDALFAAGSEQQQHEHTPSAIATNYTHGNTKRKHVNTQGKENRWRLFERYRIPAEGTQQPTQRHLEFKRLSPDEYNGSRNAPPSSLISFYLAHGTKTKAPVAPWAVGRRQPIASPWETDEVRLYRQGAANRQAEAQMAKLLRDNLTSARIPVHIQVGPLKERYSARAWMEDVGYGSVNSGKK
jgi:hypothetical protein